MEEKEKSPSKENNWWKDYQASTKLKRRSWRQFSESDSEDEVQNYAALLEDLDNIVSWRDLRKKGKDGSSKDAKEKLQEDVNTEEKLTLEKLEREKAIEREKEKLSKQLEEERKELEAKASSIKIVIEDQSQESNVSSETLEESDKSQALVEGSNENNNLEASKTENLEDSQSDNNTQHDFSEENQSSNDRKDNIEVEKPQGEDMEEEKEIQMLSEGKEEIISDENQNENNEPMENAAEEKDDKVIEKTDEPSEEKPVDLSNSLQNHEENVTEKENINNDSESQSERMDNMSNSDQILVEKTNENAHLEAETTVLQEVNQSMQNAEDNQMVNDKDINIQTEITIKNEIEKNQSDVDLLSKEEETKIVSEELTRKDTKENEVEEKENEVIEKEDVQTKENITRADETDVDLSNSEETIVNQEENHMEERSFTQADLQEDTEKQKDIDSAEINQVIDTAQENSSQATQENAVEEDKDSEKKDEQMQENESNIEENIEHSKIEVEGKIENLNLSQGEVQEDTDDVINCQIEADGELKSGNQVKSNSMEISESKDENKKILDKELENKWEGSNEINNTDLQLVESSNSHLETETTVNQDDNQPIKATNDIQGENQIVITESNNIQQEEIKKENNEKEQSDFEIINANDERNKTIEEHSEKVSIDNTVQEKEDEVANAQLTNSVPALAAEDERNKEAPSLTQDDRQEDSVNASNCLIKEDNEVKDQREAGTNDVVVNQDDNKIEEKQANKDSESHLQGLEESANYSQTLENNSNENPHLEAEITKDQDVNEPTEDANDAQENHEISNERNEAEEIKDYENKNEQSVVELQNDNKKMETLIENHSMEEKSEKTTDKEDEKEKVEDKAIENTTISEENLKSEHPISEEESKSHHEGNTIKVDHFKAEDMKNEMNCQIQENVANSSNAQIDSNFLKVQENESQDMIKDQHDSKSEIASECLQPREEKEVTVLKDDKETTEIGHINEEIETTQKDEIADAADEILRAEHKSEQKEDSQEQKCNLYTNEDKEQLVLEEKRINKDIEEIAVNVNQEQANEVTELDVNPNQEKEDFVAGEVTTEYSEKENIEKINNLCEDEVTPEENDKFLNQEKKEELANEREEGKNNLNQKEEEKETVSNDNVLDEDKENNMEEKSDVVENPKENLELQSAKQLIEETNASEEKGETKLMDEDRKSFDNEQVKEVLVQEQDALKGNIESTSMGNERTNLPEEMEQQAKQEEGRSVQEESSPDEKNDIPMIEKELEIIPNKTDLPMDKMEGNLLEESMYKENTSEFISTSQIEEEPKEVTSEMEDSVIVHKENCKDQDYEIQINDKKESMSSVILQNESKDTLDELEENRVEAEVLMETSSDIKNPSLIEESNVTKEEPDSWKDIHENDSTCSNLNIEKLDQEVPNSVEGIPEKNVTNDIGECSAENVAESHQSIEYIESNSTNIVNDEENIISKETSSDKSKEENIELTPATEYQSEVEEKRVTENVLTVEEGAESVDDEHINPIEDTLVKNLIEEENFSEERDCKIEKICDLELKTHKEEISQPLEDIATRNKGEDSTSLKSDKVDDQSIPVELSEQVKEKDKISNSVEASQNFIPELEEEKSQELEVADSEKENIISSQKEVTEQLANSCDTDKPDDKQDSIINGEENQVKGDNEANLHSKEIGNVEADHPAIDNDSTGENEEQETMFSMEMETQNEEIKPDFCERNADELEGDEVSFEKPEDTKENNNQLEDKSPKATEIEIFKGRSDKSPMRAASLALSASPDVFYEAEFLSDGQPNLAEEEVLAFQSEKEQFFDAMENIEEDKGEVPPPSKDAEKCSSEMTSGTNNVKYSETLMGNIGRNLTILFASPYFAEMPDLRYTVNRVVEIMANAPDPGHVMKGLEKLNIDYLSRELDSSEVYHLVVNQADPKCLDMTSKEMVENINQNILNIVRTSEYRQNEIIQDNVSHALNTVVDSSDKFQIYNLLKQKCLQSIALRVISPSKIVRVFSTSGSESIEMAISSAPDGFENPPTEDFDHVHRASVSQEAESRARSQSKSRNGKNSFSSSRDRLKSRTESNLNRRNSVRRKTSHAMKEAASKKPVEISDTLKDNDKPSKTGTDHPEPIEVRAEDQNDVIKMADESLPQFEKPACDSIENSSLNLFLQTENDKMIDDHDSSSENVQKSREKEHEPSLLIEEGSNADTKTTALSNEREVKSQDSAASEDVDQSSVDVYKHSLQISFGQEKECNVMENCEKQQVHHAGQHADSSMTEVGTDGICPNDANLAEHKMINSPDASQDELISEKANDIPCQNDFTESNENDFLKNNSQIIKEEQTVEGQMASDEKSRNTNADLSMSLNQEQSQYLSDDTNKIISEKSEDNLQTENHSKAMPEDELATVEVISQVKSNEDAVQKENVQVSDEYLEPEMTLCSKDNVLTTDKNLQQITEETTDLEITNIGEQISEDLSEVVDVDNKRENSSLDSYMESLVAKINNEDGASVRDSNIKADLPKEAIQENEGNLENSDEKTNIEPKKHEESPISETELKASEDVHLQNFKHEMDSALPAQNSETHSKVNVDSFNNTETELSDKKKSDTEFVPETKSHHEKMNETCVDLEEGRSESIDTSDNAKADDVLSISSVDVTEAKSLASSTNEISKTESNASINDNNPGSKSDVVFLTERQRAIRERVARLKQEREAQMQMQPDDAGSDKQGGEKGEKRQEHDITLETVSSTENVTTACDDKENNDQSMLTQKAETVRDDENVNVLEEIKTDNLTNSEISKGEIAASINKENVKVLEEIKTDTQTSSENSKEQEKASLNDGNKKDLEEKETDTQTNSENIKDQFAASINDGNKMRLEEIAVDTQTNVESSTGEVCTSSNDETEERFEKIEADTQNSLNDSKEKVVTSMIDDEHFHDCCKDKNDVISATLDSPSDVNWGEQAEVARNSDASSPGERGESASSLLAPGQEHPSSSQTDSSTQTNADPPTAASPSDASRHLSVNASSEIPGKEFQIALSQSEQIHFIETVNANVKKVCEREGFAASPLAQKTVKDIIYVLGTSSDINEIFKKLIGMNMHRFSVPMSDNDVECCINYHNEDSALSDKNAPNEKSKEDPLVIVIRENIEQFGQDPKHKNNETSQRKVRIVNEILSECSASEEILDRLSLEGLQYFAEPKKFTFRGEILFEHNKRKSVEPNERRKSSIVEKILKEVKATSPFPDKKSTKAPTPVKIESNLNDDLIVNNGSVASEKDKIISENDAAEANTLTEHQDEQPKDLNVAKLGRLVRNKESRKVKKFSRSKTDSSLDRLLCEKESKKEEKSGNLNADTMDAPDHEEAANATDLAMVLSEEEQNKEDISNLNPDSGDVKAELENKEDEVIDDMVSVDKSTNITKENMPSNPDGKKEISRTPDPQAKQDSLAIASERPSSRSSVSRLMKESESKEDSGLSIEHMEFKRSKIGIQRTYSDIIKDAKQKQAIRSRTRRRLGDQGSSIVDKILKEEHGESSCTQDKEQEIGEPAAVGIVEAVAVAAQLESCQVSVLKAKLDRERTESVCSENLPDLSVIENDEPDERDVEEKLETIKAVQKEEESKREEHPTFKEQAEKERSKRSKSRQSAERRPAVFLTSFEDSDSHDENDDLTDDSNEDDRESCWPDLIVKESDSNLNILKTAVSHLVDNLLRENFTESQRQVAREAGLKDELIGNISRVVEQMVSRGFKASVESTVLSANQSLHQEKTIPTVTVHEPTTRNTETDSKLDEIKAIVNNIDIDSDNKVRLIKDIIEK